MRKDSTKDVKQNKPDQLMQAHMGIYEQSWRPQSDATVSQPHPADRDVFLQAAESVSAAADAVTSTVSKALQGSVPQGLEAPVPKSVARANAAKVRTAWDSFCVSPGCCMIRQGCCMLIFAKPSKTTYRVDG